LLITNYKKSLDIKKKLHFCGFKFKLPANVHQ